MTFSVNVHTVGILLTKLDGRQVFLTISNMWHKCVFEYLELAKKTYPYDCHIQITNSHCPFWLGNGGIQVERGLRCLLATFAFQLARSWAELPLTNWRCMQHALGESDVRFLCDASQFILELLVLTFQLFQEPHFFRNPISSNNRFVLRVAAYSLASISCSADRTSSSTASLPEWFGALIPAWLVSPFPLIFIWGSISTLLISFPPSFPAIASFFKIPSNPRLFSLWWSISFECLRFLNIAEIAYRSTAWQGLKFMGYSGC